MFMYSGTFFCYFGTSVTIQSDPEMAQRRPERNPTHWKGNVAGENQRKTYL